MNDEVVRERIKTYLNEKGVTVYKISKSANISQTTLHGQINGEVQISGKTLYAILEYCQDLSTEWLFRGTGSMLLTDEAGKAYNVGSMGGDGDGQTNTVGDGNDINNSDLLQKMMSTIEQKDKTILELLQKTMELMASK